jgi:N-acetylglutamate synthase-like GNAT family acetyltransferase
VDGAGLAEVRAALRGAGLPADDIRERGTALFRFEDEAGPIGWAALERHGREALLRSVVVLPEHQRRGAGAEMIRRVLTAAAELGARRLWLLTETAAPFFEKLGFHRADRHAAPAAIAATTEFRGTCPASATCLSIGLPPQ